MDTVEPPVVQAAALLPEPLADWAVPVVDLAISLGCTPAGLDRDTLLLSINDVLSRSAFARVAAIENDHPSFVLPRSLWLKLTYCRHLFVDETPNL